MWHVEVMDLGVVLIFSLLSPRLGLCHVVPLMATDISLCHALVYCVPTPGPPSTSKLSRPTEGMEGMEGKGEAEELSTGPLSVLAMSVKNNTQVGVISNNRSLTGRV